MSMFLFVVLSYVGRCLGMGLSLIQRVVSKCLNEFIVSQVSEDNSESEQATGPNS